MAGLVLHTAGMRRALAAVVLVLLGACGGSVRETTAAPVAATSMTSDVPQTTVSMEPVTGGPISFDRDGNPMLGGAGPWEVVHVVSGDSLDVRKDDRVVKWRLAQVAAAENDDCHAAEALRWLQEYVAPVSHSYFAARPTGEESDADGRLPVEMLVADVARVVGDRGSVNVAVVRAGMARWGGLPDGESVRDEQERAFAMDLAQRMAAAEADARANARGLWGACPGA